AFALAIARTSRTSACEIDTSYRLALRQIGWTLGLPPRYRKNLRSGLLTSSSLELLESLRLALACGVAFNQNRTRSRCAFSMSSRWIQASLSDTEIIAVPMPLALALGVGASASTKVKVPS